MSRLPRDLVAKIQSRSILGYLISLATVGFATVVTYYVKPLHEAPTDLYFAAIVITAWLGGKGPAVLATLLSTLAVDFYIIPPIFTILIDLADVTRLIIFSMVAFSICYLQD